jgi:hypothetical protein
MKVANITDIAINHGFTAGFQSMKAAELEESVGMSY